MVNRAAPAGNARWIPASAWTGFGAIRVSIKVLAKSVIIHRIDRLFKFIRTPWIKAFQKFSLLDSILLGFTHISAWMDHEAR
jgi:hypothetical protein